MGKKQDAHSSPHSPGWLLLTGALSAGVPAALLVVLGRRGLDFSGVLVLLLLAAMALDALFLLGAGLAAARAVRLPRAPNRRYPAAGAVVLAVRGSSPVSLSETVDTLLRLPYLSPLQIVVACGSADLARTAGALIGDRNAVERAHVVELDDGSPPSLLAAALAFLDVAFIGVFLPGQRPERGAFSRAWAWLSYGFDLLHAAMRADNARESWSSRLAAVDLSGIDTPLSPIQDGGSGPEYANGSVFLTATLARKLVEEAGTGPEYRGARDWLLGVWQAVPATVAGNWRRWVGQETAVLSPSRVQGGRSAALLYCRIWRPTLVWLAPGVLAAAGYRLAQAGSHPPPSVLAPVIALLALYLAVPGVLRATFAYMLADRDLRIHRSWFVGYAFAWVLWLGAARNSAVRVAQMRLVLGRRRRLVPAAMPAVVPVPSRPDEAEVVRAREAGLDVTAGDVREPVRTDADVEPSAVPAKPLSPGALRVLQAADRLPGIIEVILSAIERGEKECQELRTRALMLEQQADQEQARMASIHALGSNTIEPAALERLRGAVAALDAHPEDLTALVTVAQQAESLACVVDGYLRLRTAALAD